MNEKIAETFSQIRRYNLWDGARFATGHRRSGYLDRLRGFLGGNLVKVLVGQRRTGKSYLLRQTAAMLLDERGVRPENILYINKEYLEYDFIRTYADLEDLYRHYRQELRPEGRVYLFIDEVQDIEGWERFVNSHSQDFAEECELLISGSNSRMLSTELATLLSGRYVEFRVFPYCYAESLTATGGQAGRESYLRYLQTGGLPEIYNIAGDEQRRQYVASVKDTVLLRDIVQRRKLRDVRLLDDIFTYIVSNASNLLSISTLAGYFAARRRKVSYDAIAAYIDYLEEAFLVHRLPRYNIRGKDVVMGNSKYYLNDLSFKNWLYPGFAYGLGYLLENAVCLDLLRFGYKVYTGVMREAEVDFVAVRGDRTIYIQCTLSLDDEATARREYAPLLAIADSYEKYIVSLDELRRPSVEGVRHIRAWEMDGLAG